jgi:hypothetical protein
MRMNIILTIIKLLYYQKETPSMSNNILSWIDSYIEQVFHIRRTLPGVSISAIIVAHIAIALSTFLLQARSLFAVFGMESEFGLVLITLFDPVIFTSSFGSHRGLGSIA